MRAWTDRDLRRPAFIVTFSIFLVANLALALQNSFPALLVLRCLQSAGSSATIALSDATVSDLCTRAERGTWLGYVYLGMSLGPALAPIIGGVLNQYLGWHSIFWFLFIYAGVIFAIMLLILPETGRAVVGNHTILPEKWNLSLVQWWRLKQERPFNGGEYFEEDKSTIQKPKRPVNPFSSLLLLFERVGGMLLAYNGILYTGYLMIISTRQSDFRSPLSTDDVLNRIRSVRTAHRTVWLQLALCWSLFFSARGGDFAISVCQCPSFQGCLPSIDVCQGGHFSCVSMSETAASNFLRFTTGKLLDLNFVSATDFAPQTVLSSIFQVRLRTQPN